MSNNKSMDPLICAQIAAVVTEFYTTNDPIKRNELNEFLTRIRTSDEGFEASFDLLDFKQPTTVQHYGACILYDTIRERWEDCISREDIASRLKRTLIEKLTLGAHFQNQSVTNKLTSSLALFALYCIPDVWTEPVHDLTVLWASQPELLLRVLAELAAEFPRVQMPLRQRSLLKSTLFKTAVDVIKVVELVLSSDDATPSLKNAAVECVEQWLKLPSLDLREWHSVLSHVFGSSSNDFAALARILTVISSHDELPSLENLAFDLCGYITELVCPEIGSQLIGTTVSDGRQLDATDMEEISPLIVAIAGFMEVVLSCVLIRSAELNNFHTLNSLCSFFTAISTWPGRYPLDEFVSDAPETFWSTLKEELFSLATRISQPMQAKLLELCRPYYARLIESAVEKLAYVPNDEYQKLYDKEQMEAFENYRLTRVDISVNSFAIIGHETCNFLKNKLCESINRKDCCRTEAVLYLFERMSDYMTEEDSQVINDILEQCLSIQTWATKKGPDESRLGNTLMSMLYSLSHLVTSDNQAAKLERMCISLVLSFINIPSVADEALRTLEKFTEDRSASLADIGDELTSEGYEYFVNEGNPVKLRLRAMKCVGYSLSLRDPQFVLESLNTILAPRLQKLQSILEGQFPTSSQSSGSLEEECLFELGVFAVLISSLKPPKTEQHNLDPQNSPLFLVLQRCLPLFHGMIKSFTSSTVLVEKVCEALRCGLVALGDKIQPLIDTYFDVLDQIILLHATVACALAKALVLVFSGSSLMPRILSSLRVWYKQIQNAYTEEIPDEYIELAYHIVKKDWKLMEANKQDADITLRAMVDISLKVLACSQDPSLCRKSAVLLATILKTCADGDQFLDILRGVGQYVITVTFTRLQSEMIKSTTEALAETLMVFARKYPMETRQCLRTLPNGDNPAVADILKEAHSSRNFKQLAMRFNIQRRKEAKA